MSKTQELQDAHEFVEEYTEIERTLNDLYDDTNNKPLKQEVSELISVLREDFLKEKEEAEELIAEIENKELDYQNYEYERSRI